MGHNTKVPAPSTIHVYVGEFRNASYERKLDMLRILLGVKYTDTSWILLLQSVYCSLDEDEVPKEFQNHYRYFKSTGKIKIFRGLNGENDKMQENNSSSSNAEVQENNAVVVEDILTEMEDNNSVCFHSNSDISVSSSESSDSE